MIASQKAGGWAVSVREILELTRSKEADLAREAHLKPPALFRYLRGTRSVPEFTVRGINQALGNRLGTRRIELYLDALAIRDELITADSELDDDIVNGILAIERHVRDGFIDAFRAHLASRKDGGRALQNDLLIDLRKRLVRSVTGEPTKENRLEAILRISAKHGFAAREWLKTDREVENSRRDDDFTFAIQRVLSETELSPADRMRCEALIESAFWQREAVVIKEHWLELREAIKRAKRVGARDARIDLLERLKRGEPIA